jgi:hypothetical protein
MTMTRMLIAGLLLAPAIAFGQKSCTWKAGDAWVKRQAEFFDDSKHDWKNDSLRTVLLNASGLTSPLKAPVNTGVQIEGRPAALGATATQVIADLTKLAATRGSTWPGRSEVGAAGAHAVYLLALRDTGFARAALHRMMEAGPLESPAVDVAVLEDHLRLVWGRKQIYGTQFREEHGKIVLAPMEDAAHADLRREDAGLPPFKLGVCLSHRQQR